jgi:TRAP-type mannitol/chloroaromatic compound transport system permease large subunit
MTVVVTGMIILIVLMVLEVPIAVAMALVGIGGFAYVVDWGPAAYMAAETSYRLVHNYNLSVIPLFILMGNLLTIALSVIVVAVWPLPQCCRAACSRPYAVPALRRRPPWPGSRTPP